MVDREIDLQAMDRGQILRCLIQATGEPARGDQATLLRKEEETKLKDRRCSWHFLRVFPTKFKEDLQTLRNPA